MAKLVRFSNLARGKKLIIFYEDLQNLVKLGINAEINIGFEDDQGAEVDDDIFLILISQDQIPNLILIIAGEENPIVFFGNSPSPLVSSTNPPLLFTNRVDEEIDNYKQILLSHLEKNSHLNQLVEETNEKGCVDSEASSILIKDCVSLFVKLKGESPSSKDQQLFAKAIILVVPFWRYQGPGSTNGTDILYNEVARSGLIQTRLRFRHTNLNKGKAKPAQKRISPFTGGPSAKIISLRKPDGEPETTIPPTDAINKPNGPCPKNSSKEIKPLFLETLTNRTYIRNSQLDSTLILKFYKKFLNCDFLVSCNNSK